MNEYIEREELTIEFMYADADVAEDYGDGECEWGFSRKRIQEVINSVPSADVAPVRHGKWEVNAGMNFFRERNCPVCKKRIESNFWNYCPNCGARMDGDADA